jgi:SPP1 family predicted phage head-tail adaptor
MRAGQLDRTIVIQASTANPPNAFGEITYTWTTFATVRAQIMQQSTEEFLRNYGTTDSFAVIFRIRWLSGVTVQHRIQYDGKTLNIREVKEIGRRHGLEIRCEEVRT